MAKLPVRRSRSIAYLRRVRMPGWTRRISPTAYARGVTVCLENARSLLDDALVLLEAKRRARATALAILALEEGDKVRRLLLLCMGPGEAKREWEAFRLHGPRLSASLSILTHGDYSFLPRSWASIRPKRRGSGWIGDLPHIAGMLRERCFYADLLRDGTWSVPSRMVPRGVCEAIIGIANVFLGITTTLALGSEMVVAGQLEPAPGWVRPESGGESPRGKRWTQWRMGRVGEPRRDSRRLHLLRGWSHGTSKQVLARGT